MNPNETQDTDLEAVHARVRADIANERGVAAMLRNRSTRVRIAIAIAAVVLAGIGLIRFFHVPYIQAHWGDSGPEPGLRSGILVGGSVLLLLLLLVRALRPMQAPPQRALDAVLFGAAMVAPLFVAGGSEGTFGWVRHTSNCFLMAVAVGWLLTGLLRSLDRSRHGDRGMGWLAVAAASLSASLAIHVACPWHGIIHRLSCHGTLGLAMAAQYMVWTRWVDRKR